MGNTGTSYMHTQTAIDDCCRRQLCVVVDTLCFRHVPVGLKLPDSTFYQQAQAQWQDLRAHLFI